jgi:hypothetical protein
LDIVVPEYVKVCNCDVFANVFPEVERGPRLAGRDRLVKEVAPENAFGPMLVVPSGTTRLISLEF